MLYFLQSGIALPRIRKVKVAGLFHIGMDEIDKAYGMCDLRLIQRLNNWKPNEISGYQVDLDKEELADTTSSYIFQHYLQPPLTSYTIKDIFPSVFDWLDLQDVNGRIILIIMAVVAIINLATALMILIIEQAKMVGLIKALGMPFHKIQQIFLYYAAIIASAGILAGNLFAWGLCELQLKTGFLKLSEDSYSMREVPVRFYWWQIATIDIITLIICVLCMWLPTLYLRRIQPAKVLQFK
jgi:lipoprotein-releasing system permease protein